MPDIAARRTEPRRFVPEETNAADPIAMSSLFDELERRDVSTRQALEDAILDADELMAVLTEQVNKAYVDVSGDTANPEYEAAFNRAVEEMLPLVKERGFSLERKLLASPALGELGEFYAVYLRNIRADVEIFREENMPLLIEDAKMSQESEKIAGNEEAQFRGQTYTMPQLEQFFEETDAGTREEAWMARAAAFLADAARLDELFDQMYEVRQRIAANVGFQNYRDYKFAELKRFDYTPDDCLAFHEAVERYVVPLVEQEREERKKKLGVATLRPWDAGVRPNDPIVDPDGRAPLRPFETVGQLRVGCELIFRQVDPELGGFFRIMVDQRLLDLENRPGKAPGAYMTTFPDLNVPFIMANSVGVKRDVDTVLHEGGHAFHYFLARRQRLREYHTTTDEFSEVASQGMELLARPYLGVFYSEEELGRLRDEQLRAQLRTLPWIAMLDSFQHWLYTAGEHGPEARRKKWAEIEERFRPGIDWSGLEEYRDIGWQYPHVFSVPFYYIEYGIALLAALQVWLNSLQDERAAVQAYKHALSLGGSQPLPRLFEAVGAEFAFGGPTVSRIARGIVEQVGRR